MHHTSRQSLVVVFLFTLACGSEPTPKPPSNLPPPNFPPPADAPAGGIAGAGGAPVVVPGAIAGQGATAAGTAGRPTPNAVAGAPAVPPPKPSAPAPQPSIPAAAFSYATSNVDAAKANFGAAPDAKLDCGVTEIDTSGSVTFTNWCGPQPTAAIELQAGGSELAVVTLRSLAIASDHRLVVTGSRPLVLLVQGEATIAGALDASAQEKRPGPGGDLDCAASRGGDGQGRERRNGGGGGGGGFGTPGGGGGDDDGNRSEAGAAGVVRGNAELVPLVGGCGGGIGGGCEAAPGAGGGAVQLSVGGALKVTGEVLANGSAGSDACANDGGGAGGGSGGSILLEAKALDVSGATIEALGGSGGRAHEDGRDDVPAPGALDAMSTGGEGRRGDGSGAGGGGGGFGRVRLRAETTCTECSSLL